VCEDLCNANLMHSKPNLHVANLSCWTIWNKHATGQKFGQPRYFFFDQIKIHHRGRPGSFGLSRLWIFARLIVSSYPNNWKYAARKIFLDWIVSDCIYHRRKQRMQRLCRSSWSPIPPLPRTARVAPLNKTLPQWGGYVCFRSGCCMCVWSNLCACLCSLRLALVGRSCLLSQKHGKEADFFTVYFHWMFLKFCLRSTIFFFPRKEAIYFGFICVIHCLELGAANDAKGLASVPALTSMGWLLAWIPTYIMSLYDYVTFNKKIRIRWRSVVAIYVHLGSIIRIHVHV